MKAEEGTIIDKPSRLLAIAESLLVTAIRASSVVFVKIGLDYMGPLTTAGLRYCLAFVILLPFVARNGNAIHSISRRSWIRLFIIGISACTIGNGALSWGLKYIPATTGSFLASLIPLFVLFAGILWLKEIPTYRQVAGVIVCLIGGAFFFSLGLRPGEPRGIIIVLVGLSGYVLFDVLGREVARERQVDTLALTAIPLAIGGGCLLLIALFVEGIPHLSMPAWGVVLWLAVVNTALANAIYNHSLRVLTALEMSVMFNLAPLVTALLAWVLLQERLDGVQVAGIVTVIIGVLLVQHSPTRVAKESTV